jgi:hypothetical protein
MLMTLALRAQLMAYWCGIAFIVEDLLPVVIRRPPTVTAVIPAGDPCIGSGSKRNAIGHRALLSPFKRVLSKLPTLAHPYRRHRNRLRPKKDTIRHPANRTSRPRSVPDMPSGYVVPRYWEPILGIGAEGRLGNRLCSCQLIESTFRYRVHITCS